MERIRLKDFLEKAKIAPSVKYIVFRCSDGYDVGIPLDKGLMDDTNISIWNEFTPLTSKHGFPLRAYSARPVWDDESKMDH